MPRWGKTVACYPTKVQVPEVSKEQTESGRVWRERRLAVGEEAAEKGEPSGAANPPAPGAATGF